MSIYFLRPTNGSDSNDGLDFHGFALSAGSYDDTGNGSGEKYLSESGAFTSYTWNSGDTIYLSGGAGITPGLYEIASKVDANGVLLVTSAGSDSTADVTSSTGAFKTFQIGIDNCTASGDQLRCCTEGSAPHETTAAQVDVDLCGGSNDNNPVRIQAASGTTGVAHDDGTMYHLQASSSMTRMLYHNNSGGKSYDIEWEYIIFDANSVVTTNTMNGSSGSAGLRNGFYRCIFRDGPTARARASQMCWVQCRFEDVRLWLDGPGQGAYSCVSVGTTDTLGAFSVEGTSICVGCVTIDCYIGYAFSAVSAMCVLFINCLAYNSTSHGFNMSTSSTAPAGLFNCSSVSNGGYGFYYNGLAKRPGLTNAPHTYNNTSGATDYSGGFETRQRPQTGDPGFASTTSGSEDFEVTGVPLMQNGTPLPYPGATFTTMGDSDMSVGLPIGAVGVAAGGGGGGGGGAVIIGSPIIRGKN